MRFRYRAIWASCAMMCALAGCADAPDGTPSAASAPAVPPLPAAAPTPAVTPGAELPPVVTPAPAPTPDDGRVTVADGFWYAPLSDEVKTRITGMSYPADDADAAIGYGDLRYVGVRYYDFEGNVHGGGELIVNERVAEEVAEIFHALYQEKYPFTSIRLVDDFGQPGDDTLSMEANNTSAFCYRPVTGTAKLSRHSYGAAIDINPLYNPYIDRGRVAPENSAMYVDRTLNLPGMIDRDDACYQIFIARGWTWGGDWRGDKDYQHFSKDLGY